MADKPPHMTMEQIIASVTEIAQDSEDRDRFKALKMLASANQATVVLPDPLTVTEVLQRMVRVMKPAGPQLARLAFGRAFRRSTGDPESAPNLKWTDEYLTGEQRELVESIDSLKKLYKAFPYIKRGGMPPGYPMGRGRVIQKQWLQQAASRILIDQLRAESGEADPIAKEDWRRLRAERAERAEMAKKKRQAMLAYRAERAERKEALRDQDTGEGAVIEDGDAGPAEEADLETPDQERG